MKNKIIAFFVLLGLFAPLFSNASIVIPDVALNIIVNTQEQDFPFNFSLKVGGYEFDENDDYYEAFFDYENFSLQTQNFTASADKNIWGWGNFFLLSQENVPEGLKLSDIKCTSSTTSISFSYKPNGVIIRADNTTWGESVSCTFNNTKTKTPVLIVPGLMGTEIKNGNSLVWIDPVKLVSEWGDAFMDVLAFNSNLISESSLSGGSIIKKEPFFDYSDGLINEFKNQGYIEDQNLFTFPYDWRYGVSGKYENGKTNSDLLGEKISQILQQTGSPKIDVVAHSMGGLVVKKYVMDNPASHKIGKAIFVGVPNTGSPKAVKVLLQGDNFGIPWLADSEMKKVAENMPASYDLLPSQEYYNQKGSFIQVVDEGSEWPSDMQITIDDLDYQETEQFLADDHKLNSLAFDNAEALHTESFDNFDLRTAGVDLYSINGCKKATLGKITERRYADVFGTQVVYQNPKYFPGDGTVTLESATNLPIDQNKKFYFLPADHSKMLSADGSRQKIVNLISGSALNVGSSITQDISQCNLNGRAISVYSPVDISVTDQDGNKIGLAEDGSVLNEIPNASFEIWGEHKFVFLPEDNGEIYDISLNGTGSGTFTIKSQDIEAGQIAKTESFINLPVTDQLQGQMKLAENSTTVLVKQSPEGELQTIEPAIVSAGDDVLPPEVKIDLSGTEGQNKFFRSNVSIKIQSQDDKSGIFEIRYKIDDDEFHAVPENLAVFTAEDEGLHKIRYFAADKAGNNSIEQEISFVIDKTPPEAAIEFDKKAKDLKFSGTDNISDPSKITVLDKDNIVTIKDEAENITEIRLKDKNRKLLMRAEIKSLKYNGVASDVSKNKMDFLWFYDKKGSLKILSQHVQSKKDYNVLAVFDGKNTKITGKDETGKISKKIEGLKILRVSTNKGNLRWSY